MRGEGEREYGAECGGGEAGKGIGVRRWSRKKVV